MNFSKCLTILLCVFTALLSPENAEAADEGSCCNVYELSDIVAEGDVVLLRQVDRVIGRDAKISVKNNPYRAYRPEHDLLSKSFNHSPLSVTRKMFCVYRE